jgi:hypothetical protein
MPFLLGCLALFFPRVVFVLVWLLVPGYFGAPFEHWVFPVLGFLFVPLTTLAYAFSFNTLGIPGELPPMGWVLVILAAFIDFGLVGGRSARRRWRRRRPPRPE